jgi:cAMP phosphodiesterase
MSRIDLSSNRLDDLDELVDAVSHGAEVEFNLYNNRYLMEMEGKRVFIAICPDGDGDYYDNANDLVHNWRDPNEKTLAEAWKDIDLIMM